MAKARAKTSIRRAIDWGELAPLRIRSRLVAEGVYSGAHRSLRRGAGIEFGGHRVYTPGDDLRWIDKRSLLRHDRLLVRQFETETERALRLVLDASASMGYRGSRAPCDKLAFGAIVVAALARVALGSGDPVGLGFHGGEDARTVPVGSGRESFERIIASLEGLVPGGDVSKDTQMFDRALGALARAARRGSIVVLVSDLIDLPDDAPQRIGAMAARGLGVVVLQVLDPDEIDLPFDGTVRLKSLEADLVVETDTHTTREGYLRALAELRAKWEEELVAKGGAFVTASSADDPVATVRKLIEVVR